MVMASIIYYKYMHMYVSMYVGMYICYKNIYM